MEVRELRRVVIDRWISVARLPLDAAFRLLPGDGSTARLAIDGSEATIRRAVGALLNDDAMCADAQRRRVAVDERRHALELRDAADDKRRTADSQLSEELQRASELREQSARDAEAKLRKTEAEREQRKARVREAAAAKERLAEEARVAKRDALDEVQRRERLQTIDAAVGVLDQEAEALVSEQEAERLRAAASRAKAERKNDS